MTTNRPDCLCHVGIAREMAAAIGETVREPDADHRRRAAQRGQHGAARRPSTSRIPRAVRASRCGSSRTSRWRPRRSGCSAGCARSGCGRSTTSSTSPTTSPTSWASRCTVSTSTASSPPRVTAARSASVVVRRGRGRADCSASTASSARVGAGGHGGVRRGHAGQHRRGHRRRRRPRSTTPPATSSSRRPRWDGPTIRATSQAARGAHRRVDAQREGAQRHAPAARARPRRRADRRPRRRPRPPGQRRRPRAPAATRSPRSRSAAPRSRALLGYPVDATEAATVAGPPRVRRRAARRRAHRDGAPLPPRRLASSRTSSRRWAARSGTTASPAPCPGGARAVTTLAAEAPIEDRRQGRARRRRLRRGDHLVVHLAGAGRRRSPGSAPAAPRSPCATRSARNGACCAPACSPGVVQAVAGNLRRGVEEVRPLRARPRLLGGGAPRPARRGRPPTARTLGCRRCRRSRCCWPPRRRRRRAAGAARRSATCRRWSARLAADLGGGAVDTEPAGRPGAARRAGPRLLVRRPGGRASSASSTADALARFEVQRAGWPSPRCSVDALIPAEPPPRRYLAPPRHPAVVQDLAVTVPDGDAGRGRAAGDPRGRRRAAGERRPLRRVPRSRPRRRAARAGRSGSSSARPTAP